MERLLESIVSNYFNYIKSNEKLNIEINDLKLELIPEKDHKCLARIWDTERKNPNLRCNREGKFNGLCKTHFMMRPLKFKLITEDPPELEMLRYYRQTNPNVDYEIEVLKTNKVILFNKSKEIKKIVKDKYIIISKPMNSSSVNFKQVINNLKSIIIEKKYPLDTNKILDGIIMDYKLQSINESKKEHIRNLIEENLIEIEIEYNKIKAEEEKKKVESKKKMIKVKLPKKIEETCSYITTTSTFVSNDPTYDSDDSDEDIEKSISMRELMLEYTELINELNIKVPPNYCSGEDVTSIRIVDLDNQSDLICYEYHINNEKNKKVILINLQGAIIGEKRKWIDNNIPNEYKNNEEQVLHPDTCLPLDEYEIYICSSMFHNLTPKVYREYRWDDLFNGLQATNEIYVLIDEE
jgi:hypothetical protein